MCHTDLTKWYGASIVVSCLRMAAMVICQSMCNKYKYYLYYISHKVFMCVVCAMSWLYFLFQVDLFGTSTGILDGYFTGTITLLSSNGDILNIVKLAGDKHIEAKTNRVLFGRWHFQMHFL